ncbi:Glycoside hydrolase family 43 protein [Dioscorea alata]|uniref:Glycoside hydrolase family 43 protein n=2 Tax=Dioscorea alata TaxID=55571 RepID=A0ACB7UWQ1_DIOAL|nr:Glycoside hydrolase family 43 protein [Dioscorea alata]KAH7665308.1 Glycoside hydrolase family 43 protein [Dioscorea alata]
MRMRNKHRKSSAFHCYAGSRCTLPLVVWSLFGFIAMFYFYSTLHRHSDLENQIRLNHLAMMRELEEVEEESFHFPTLRGKRSPRAFKRRGPRKPPSVIDEFLDESSDLRSFFFPDHKTAIDPRQDDDVNKYLYPGRIWLDTEGNPIQAHGGGLLFDERRETFYWYGENKDGLTYHAHQKGAARVDIIGVSCYSSKDLWTWTNEGVVLPGDETNITHDLHKLNVLERPKVLYNDKTDKFVMWMHIDDVNYTKASVGVAVSESPTGPFEYLYSKRPHGFESRDMTVFKDDDGKAYLIYSSEDNSELHISPLTDDYLDVTNEMRRILVGQHREAPALFKYQGTYYMITSGCTGWAPNRALAHAAESIMGPWETMGNPCVGGNKIFRMTTFFSQSTYVVPLPGLPGSFVFMADRWNPSELRDSRYVWLPLRVGGVADEPLEYNFGFPLWSRVSVYWHRRWRLPDGWMNAQT